MLKDYYACRAWLEGFIPYTYSKSNLGLERVSHLLKLLGNPQEKFKSIHVAGTSGKGSTAFYLARALREAQKFQIPNYKLQTNPKYKKQKTKEVKIGLHISPHLNYIGERMQINGKAISPPALIKLVNFVKPKVESMKKTKVGLPSYFEILVATSFLYFAKEKVDIAIVEVGLGGRLDATNVLQPLITVITNVGLDHTEILGNTIEEIAREKAGIIKSKISNFKYQISNIKLQKGGVPVVTAASGKALQVIEKAAKVKKSPLMTISTLQKQDKHYFDLLLDIKDHIDTESRAGVYVTDECFFLVNLALYKLGIRFNENEQRRVFSARFAARFEEIDDGILVDGAHNRDKVRALIKWIQKKGQVARDQRPGTGIILVCGFKKGKDWKGILKLLLRDLDIESVYATQFVTPTDTGFFAAVEPEEIRNFLISNVKCFNNSQEAVWEAINSDQKPVTSNQKLILITGSLYLAGEARTLWHLPQV